MRAWLTMLCGFVARFLVEISCFSSVLEAATLLLVFSVTYVDYI